MNEPTDVDVEDVEESSSENESDDSSESESNSTSEEDSSSTSSSSSSAHESADDDEDIWSLEEDIETEEAQEVGLHDEFMKALQLIVDGHEKLALRMIKNILQHPLLSKYNTDPDAFDWERARKEARENGMSISGMARLYASLHYHIAMLGEDPVRHYFCALTVYMNDDSLWVRLGECAMERRDWPTALFAFHNGSGWHAVNGTVICMYKQGLYLECLTKLASVLPFVKQYTTGLAIKRSIRNSGSYWEARCREVFHEDPAYDKPESLETVMAYDAIMKKLDGMESMEPEKQPERRIIRIDRKLCTTIADIGTLLCNAYDNMQDFGSLALDVVVLEGNEVAEAGGERPIIKNAVEEMLDCVCVLESVIGQLNEPSSSNYYDSECPRKRKRMKRSLEWSRRSTRFRTEFNVDDNGTWEGGGSQLQTLLKDACVLERSIKPLQSIKCTAPIEDVLPELVQMDAAKVDEEFLVQRYIDSAVTVSEGENIFTAIRRLLFFVAANAYRWHVSDKTREVLTECYLRWTTCDSHDCKEDETKDAYVHLLGAELGCREAIFKCAHFIGNEGLPCELLVRLHWMLALSQQYCSSSPQCYAHLMQVCDLLSAKSESRAAYASLVSGHDCISLYHAQSLIHLVRREETLNMIADYFSGRHFLKAISLIETSFDWSEAEHNEIESTVLILVDSYIGIESFNEAARWLSRAIDYLTPFSSVDWALQRVHEIDMCAVDRECVSNLVHAIAPLLMSEPYKADMSLWMFVYKAACTLEGERTVESLRALYNSGSLMLNSSLNVLVIAHDKLAESCCCYAENYRFLMFELRELARVRSERCVDEAVSDGLHAEQLRAFIDEVHQCMFCMFGCPSRWKRTLEEHGGIHAYEPSDEDAACIVSLLLPDTLPTYNGALCPDLIEIVQKKLVAFVQPTGEEITKVGELDEFIRKSGSEVGEWARCSSSNELRTKVFYMLAMNAFRSLRVEETLQYTKLFLVTSAPNIGASVLHCAWTMLSFFGISALFKLTEDEVLEALASAISPFRMALHFCPDSQDVLFNFGSALYQIRSKLVRFGRKLESDDVRIRWIRIRTAGMLEESQRLFSRCESLLSAGDPDMWRCHYFLAKIADKLGGSINEVMEHHYESARQLEASGVQYPMRVSAKKQEHIEAVELHYRAYAYLVKWLVESDVEWTREQLAQMLSFAETFRDHGVCRRNTTPDAFARAPFIRDFVGQLIYTTHIADMDEVTRCLDNVVEKVHLIDSVLAICSEGFEVCIKRFPHFKSYYRLAQLAVYRNDFATASSLLFTRLFARKKTNNPDNIFENLVAVTQKDLDRGDSLQYHVNRIASLAIAVSSKTLDCISLISLLHTFCTLTFCGNTDYLLPDDLQKVYRCAASVLINCVREKVSCGEDSVSLAVLLYDLYQYAERNNEKKLCVCLRKCLVIIAPHLDGFIAGSDPMEVTYQLYLQSKQRPTKRRSKAVIVPVAPKVARFDVPVECAKPFPMSPMSTS